MATTSTTDRSRPDGYVLGLEEVDRTDVGLVGGKGAQLGELARLDDVRVPAGCCITTTAFDRVLAEAPGLDELLDRLDVLGPHDREAIRTASAAVRDAVEAATVPTDVAAAIAAAVHRLGADGAYAVRSSATAEDLPTASFAGQHDSSLDVAADSVLGHVRRCWASLFTERAVAYRSRRGLGHREIRMAVVVQRMVDADASGVLFTADPRTSNRRVASIEATTGLGEALVSGRAPADVYTVRDGAVVDAVVAAERVAGRAAPDGGGADEATDPTPADGRVLTDDQAVRLVALGRRIEAHLGCPQDIEWCLAGDELHVVQSRPITTLYPIPRAADDGPHVYVSVGHAQMMTDAMTPFGLSMFQLTALRPMHEAGSRLFVDVVDDVASPAGRAALLDVMGRSDPLVRDALETVLGRDGFVPLRPDAAPIERRPPAPPDPLETSPSVVGELMARNEASVAALQREIGRVSGTAMLDVVRADLAELKRLLFDPQGHQVVMAGMEARWWLEEHLRSWLGDRDAVDTLTQSVPDNVTSRMGLALADVADAVRPHPEVVAFLERVEHEAFLDELAALPGGPEAAGAIRAYLDAYGMRCVGEIDITRPRWRERPTTLVPLILGHVRNLEPGAAARRFEQGRREALAERADVLARLRELPDGAGKAEEAARMIDRVRAFSGYREYPKFGLVRRYGVYREALVREADRLVRDGVLDRPDDMWFLTFDEVHDTVRTGHADRALIRARREAFAAHQALSPPRVLTSEGEVVDGAHRRAGRPDGALVGLAVSAGVVEGRARVIRDLAAADVEPGDILVTTYTDPSWSPLFVAVAGVVTEVGGLMTHGAVIAREYGLPAVVGVDHATRRIPDGHRVRVDGTAGYVELLAPS